MAHRPSDGSSQWSARSARLRMPLLPSLGRVTVRALTVLLLLVALAVCVQRVVAVPFSSLSPPPALQLVKTPSATLCVLMAAGRGVSSISAADLAQFAGQQCDRPQLGPLALSAVDLSPTSSLCSTGGLQPITLSALLPGVAVLAAVLLGLQDNTQRTTELLPPSATPLARTARGSWQITMRVHTGEDAATMAIWCRSDNAALLSRQSGFSSGLIVRTVPTDASCSIAADCRDCRVSAESAAAFRLPYSAQLIEWELWVHSAVPAAWDRQYGVLTQMPGGRLLDAESELRFSVMESYFADERSAAFAPGVAAADKSRSGFELNFLSLSSIEPQSAATLSAESTVSVSFALQKSDVVLETVLSDKQSLLQLDALIASAVVSLFSIFAIGFRMVEAHIFRRCGVNTGDVRGSSRAAVNPADPTLTDNPAAASSAPAAAEYPFSISVSADPPSLADFCDLQRVQPSPPPADSEPRADEAADRNAAGSMLPDHAAASDDWHAQL